MKDLKLGVGIITYDDAVKYFGVGTNQTNVELTGDSVEYIKKLIGKKLSFVFTDSNDSYSSTGVTFVVKDLPKIPVNFTYQLANTTIGEESIVTFNILMSLGAVTLFIIKIAPNGKIYIQSIAKN